MGKKKPKKKTQWEKVDEFATKINSDPHPKNFNASYLLGRLVEKIFQASGEEVDTEAVGFFVSTPEAEEDEDAEPCD